MITVDNGSKFYARSTDSWAYGQGVRRELSRPGKPIDNPFIESFNGRLRDEHLNVQWQLTEAARGEILNLETV